MALTFSFLCSFNFRQAERRFLTWLFTFLVLEWIRRMASRGKEQGEGFFQALQKSDDAWNALCSPKPIVGCHLLDQADRLGRELWLSRLRL